MACFLVPAAEAVISSIATKIVKANEKEETVKVSLNENTVEEVPSVKLSTKLSWLNKLLWGGSALLAFEHVWHGEVIASAPFLTAISDGTVSEMLTEMSTTGVTMAAIITCVWGGMVAIASKMQKSATKDAAKENA